MVTQMRCLPLGLRVGVTYMTLELKLWDLRPRDVTSFIRYQGSHLPIAYGLIIPDKPERWHEPDHSIRDHDTISSMSLDLPGAYASGVPDDNQVPIFDVQKVTLQFDVSADFVAAQVANNVLILALSSGRLLRFDLDNAADIDDIDLPKRPAEIGVIRRLFLDPSASHLIVSTALGENYYLHTQSRQPKALARLKGVQIESIAWNPSQPTASTREILIGAADGQVYETYIEPSTEFYRRE